MKREFLKGLELTDEQINKVMAEYGVSVEKSKTELNELKEKLKISTDTITNLEASKGNVEETQKKLEEYQENFNKIQQENLKIKKDYAIDSYLANVGVTSKKIIKALLDDNKITFEEDKLGGIDELITALKEDEETKGLFVIENKPPLQTGGTHNDKVHTEVSDVEKRFLESNPGLKL